MSMQTTTKCSVTFDEAKLVLDSATATVDGLTMPLSDYLAACNTIVSLYAANDALTKYIAEIEAIVARRRPGRTESRWQVTTCGKPSTHFGHMGLICVLEAGHDGDHSAVPPTSIIFKKQPGARIETLDDETLEMLIEAVLNLTCKYPLADVVHAIAFHARATGEGADNDKQGAAWRTAANALDDAMMLVARAEEISK